MNLIYYILFSCFFIIGAKSKKKPHIVLILADDYGWNDIGYHNSKVYTPTLDKLAANGVKLNNYYVQPICTPSRSQLLTGRYQIHTGLQHSLIWIQQPNGLPLGFTTVAEAVKTQGYVTHMVGKWHLGFYKQDYTPLRRGFDSFYGYLSGSERYFTHRRCVSKRCGLDLRDNDKPDWSQKGKYSTNIFAEKAKQIIANHASNHTEQPMFLYLPFQSVHMPLEVPKQYLARYDHVKDANRRVYLAMTSCMDDAVETVVQQLRNSRMWDDTVLIFSSDNGGQVIAGGNNWPLRGWKGSLWEGGIRAVGFVSAGNNIRMENRGSINDDLLHITDWMPTIMHLAGVNQTIVQGLDGFNIWPTLGEGNPGTRKEILHNIDPMFKLKGVPRANSSFSTNVRAAIRYKNWKLITGDPGDSRWVPEPTSGVDNMFSSFIEQQNEINEESEIKLEKQRIDTDRSTKNVWLFDISTDPNEENDLSLRYPRVVDSLLKRLASYNSSAVPVIYPDLQPQESDPANFGGVWSPWQ